MTVLLGVLIAIAANVAMAAVLNALGIPWVWTSDRGIVALLWR